MNSDNAQKDPLFLAEVSRLLSHLSIDVDIEWVGDGSEENIAALRAAGVRVVGWKPRPAVLDRLLDADLYLHTAAWEGFPVTLSEAIALGVPCIVRSIPATVAIGFQGDLLLPQDVANAIYVFASSGILPAGPLGADTGNAGHLARALMQVYHAKFLYAGRGGNPGEE